MMLWASHRLRSGTISLKIAAHRWIVSHAPASLQQPKWPGHCQSERSGDAGLSCDYLRNCRRGGSLYFFGIPFWPKLCPWREWQRNSCWSYWWWSKSNFLLKSLRTCWIPCSPDMAPCDLWLSPKLKRSLKGKQFQTRADIMTAMTAESNSILKEAFLECFQQWQHHSKNCVESQGENFEGEFGFQHSRYACFFFPPEGWILF